jgi:hypothetical protein
MGGRSVTLFAALLCECLEGMVSDRSLRATTRHLRKDGWQRSTLLLLVLMIAGAGAASQAQPGSAPKDSEWHEFSGTWTAAGNRKVIGLGGDRRASVADYSGSLMLYGTSRPALGFRAEAVVLNDSATGLIGRAVWTDEADNHVYSELRDEATPAGNRIVGTFVGGSGRYKGATGTYEFSWRFLLEAEDGTVQGQSMGLSGKVRLVPTQSGPGAKSEP